MTSASKHTEWILETIDHLRRRKARPDLARICHVVRRRFGLSPTDTEAKLEKLVDAEVVIKVDYKGSVSYRNAAKWRKSMLGCGVLNSTSISTKILEAILEISRATESYVAAHARSSSKSTVIDSANNNNNNGSENNDSDDKSKSQSPEKQVQSAAAIGVPLESINVWLKVNCEGFSSLRSPLTVILKREIDAGRVKRLGNGNYVISQTQMAAISSGTIKPLKNVKRVAEASNPTTSLPVPVEAAGASNAVTDPTAKVGSSERPSHGVTAASQSRSTVLPARRGRPPKHRPSLAAGASSLTDGGSSTAQASKQIKVSGDNTTYHNNSSCTSSVAPAQARPDSHSQLKRMLASELSSLSTNSSATDSNSKTSGGGGLAVESIGVHPGTASESDRVAAGTGGDPNRCSSLEGPVRKIAKRSAAPGDVLCDFCGLSSLANPRGEPEALLQCKDCTAKAHPSCMKYSRLLASRACRAPWQCMDCKTCFMCQDSGDPYQMLFCDGCDRGFHMNCHRPTVSKKPSGIWECSDCRLENLALQRSEITAAANSRPTLSQDSAPLTPAESPVPVHVMPTSPMYLGEGRYPDASGWSVEDVAQFLTSAGFSQQAQLFKEQEIDGVSLLLLKRSDVLKGLDMKLGPALKVNRLVQGLQTARQGIL